jgi:glycosyltransferase 2 family protein
MSLPSTSTARAVAKTAGSRRRAQGVPARRHTEPGTHRRRWTRWGVLAIVPIVFLAVPSLTHLPARLVAGCPKWIALAVLLELMSILGFIASFALVFGPGMTGRRSLVGALRALGASTVLPAGSLVGPAIGVRSASPGRAPLTPLVRSTIAFTLLTLAPGVVVLGFFGVSLWLGWPSGPHGAVLTLPAAAVAATLLAIFFMLGRPALAATSPHHRLPGLLRWTDGRPILREGAADAGRVIAARNWKLLGTLGYYAFDNAVLWAAFRAYGHAPPVGVIVMGYLVGSLGSVIPVPAGLGVVDGGLIGALVVYGAPAAPAAGAVLLYRGISLGLAVALSAGAWAVTRSSREKRVHADSSAEVSPARVSERIPQAHRYERNQQPAAGRAR